MTNGDVYFAMKKVALLNLIALPLLFAVSACHFMGSGVKGSGIRKAEKRDLPSFNAIDAEGAYEIDVTCQRPLGVELEADDNILPLIQTDVRDGVLYVRNERAYNIRDAAALRISLPNLVKVDTKGAGTIQIAGLKNDKFEIQSSGVSKVKASGETKSVNIQCSGAGMIDAQGLRAERARVNLSGAASIHVYASDQLDVDVSGAGRVTYSGDPKVNKHVTGAAIVTKK